MNQTYLRRFCPGLIMAEASEVWCPESLRDDPLRAASIVPDGCFAFEFFDREEVTVNGEVLVGKNKNKSPRYFIGGYMYSPGEAQALEGEENWNLRSYGESGQWLVKTKLGNWQFANAGDVCICPDGRMLVAA